MPNLACFKSAQPVTWTATDGQGHDYTFSTQTASLIINVGGGVDRTLIVGLYDAQSRTLDSITFTPSGGAASAMAQIAPVGNARLKVYACKIPDGVSSGTFSAHATAAFGVIVAAFGVLTGVRLQPYAIVLHPSDSVADPQSVPRSDQTPPTISIPPRGTAVCFEAETITSVQVPTWGGLGIRDAVAEASITTNSGAMIVTAHAFGPQTGKFTVAGSVGNGFGFNSAMGVALAWGP